VLVAAFDQPVGVQQEPVAEGPAGGERGEVLLQAQRQRGRPAGQRPQAAAGAQQRRVMAAADDGQLAAGAIWARTAVTKSSGAQVRADGPADLARHVLQRGRGDRAAPKSAQHLPGEQDGRPGRCRGRPPMMTRIPCPVGVISYRSPPTEASRVAER